MPESKNYKKVSAWRCPSNIAIVKYWGKMQNQIPANSSVSMTLSESYTEIELELSEKKNNADVELEYWFEGKKNLQFEEKVHSYLKRNQELFPVLKNYAVKLSSKNSFPHSAGIASSASAFGAISLVLLDGSYPDNYEKDQNSFLNQASYLARLGSGSACRSMYPNFNLWGANNQLTGSSDEFAIELPRVHPNFLSIQDSVLIIDDQPKKVSSTLGHSLMKDHVYAENRFNQANKRTTELLDVLSSGDFERFIEITESEALTLHAMMMTSRQPYLLMKPETLSVIDEIIKFRIENNIPICFTLDAGPNVHVLYPENEKPKVEAFLLDLMENDSSRIITDKIGTGPIKLY